MDFLLAGHGVWILVVGLPALLIASLLFIASRTKRFEKRILQALMAVFGVWMPLALLGTCASIYGAGHTQDYVKVQNASARTVEVIMDNRSPLILGAGESGEIDAYGGFDTLVVSTLQGERVVTFEFEYGPLGDDTMLTIRDPAGAQ
jgi:hypothetical protein